MNQAAEPGIDTSVIWSTFDRMGNDVLRMLPLWVAGLFVFVAFWALASGTRRVVARIAGRASQFPSAATAFAVSHISPSCCSAFSSRRLSRFLR